MSTAGIRKTQTERLTFIAQGRAAGVSTVSSNQNTSGHGSQQFGNKG